ncbi:unnamed protein product [Blepharisma stoltei]|uniref:Uncharacterized protein n=1 Tax=Blepharisma stoltei TaxID=1481888 RepID=A0AAU9I3A5_9CILI|nr:unnamed protein product [Blepharisma stoltei]
MTDVFIITVPKALEIEESLIIIKLRLKFSDTIHCKNSDNEFELQTSAKRIKESEKMNKRLIKSRKQ